MQIIQIFTLLPFLIILQHIIAMRQSKDPSFLDLPLLGFPLLFFEQVLCNVVLQEKQNKLALRTPKTSMMNMYEMPLTLSSSFVPLGLILSTTFYAAAHF